MEDLEKEQWCLRLMLQEEPPPELAAEEDEQPQPQRQGRQRAAAAGDASDDGFIDDGHEGPGRLARLQELREGGEDDAGGAAA